MRFVPDDDTPRFARGALYRDNLFALANVTHAAVQIGIARGAIEGYLERIQERKRRGVSLTLDPLVQSALGKSDALVRAGRAGLKEAVAGVWDTILGGQRASHEQRAQMLAAKTHAVWSAIEATDLMYETMGSQALMQGNPVERRFRDIHATEAHLMSSKHGYRVAGAVLLGVDPGPTPLFT